ncbi:MAG: PEP-CTERM sorting domain-containing protein [Cyanobacteria bacterium P01_E01_bin.42]
MRQWFAATAAALALCTLGIGSARAGTFTDTFDSGASSLWGNERGNWTVTDGNYGATFPDDAPVNASSSSSLPFLLSDFSVDLDINNIQDGGVWLRSAEDAGTALGRTGVLLVTGGLGGVGTGLYWHIVTDGNNAGSILNPIDGLFDPGITDASIRVEVVGDTYSAFLNDSSTPVTTLVTDVFSSGQVALFNSNSGQTFDSFGVESSDIASTVPEPSSAILFALMGAGVVVRYRSRDRQ